MTGLPVVGHPVLAGHALLVGHAVVGHTLLGVHSRYSTPTPDMDALQITLLVLVAGGATVVVLTRRPVRQVICLSAYGLMLALLFLAFQAPDVTLSELAVGAVALPAVILLALAKVRRQEE